MVSFRRLVLALLALLAAGNSVGAATAAAQDAPVRVADAQAFLGNWAVVIDAQGQNFTMNVDIKDADGNVAAEMSNEMAPAPSRAQRVAKSGENLVLTFSLDAQGQQVPIVMTLTPAQGALNANVDFAGGMFVTTGKGTKR